jgi:hypothetical protein
VAGILGMFRPDADGIAYEGYRGETTGALDLISQRLADAVIKMFENSDFREKCCMNAREHAKNTHDGNKNYRRLLEIYSDIAEK